MSANTPLLRVEGLSVGYTVRGRREPAPAVVGASFQVGAGEMVAIVGESGSGKSTLAAALVGLLPGNAHLGAGRIVLQGGDVGGFDERAWRGIRGRRIGFVPQDPGLSLDPVKRVGEQIAEALVVHGVPARQARDRVAGILADVGLAGTQRIARAFPHELSGGMRQRVLIGIAVANEPALIIADEPTSALDVTVQRQVLDHLDELTRRKNIAVLLITHDLGVAYDRADHLVVMQQGRIVEAGPSRKVFEQPQHPYTRMLLAAAPGLNARSVPGAGLRGGSSGRPSGKATTPENALLTVEGLVKSFGSAGHRDSVLAVDGVSFHVPRHGTTGLVGESGSGKSTTARIVLCLERPSAGRVQFDGRDVTHLSGASLRDFRRRVQVVYQNPYASLNPRFTMEEIITEPLRAFGMGTAVSRRDRAAELLQSVELSPQLLDSRPVQLSGGQRQRVAIARALAINPELVVLDEPVSALDVSVQARILALLGKLQAELGVSYLFVSHDLAVVRQIADHVVVLRGGRVVEQGATARIFNHPSEPYTRTLLSDTPGARQERQEHRQPVYAPKNLNLAA